MSEVKEKARKIVEALPEGASWQDLIEEIYFRLKVDQGLTEIENGEGIPWEEVKAEFGLR